MRFQLTPGRPMDVLLDLPWHEPLTRWDEVVTVDGPAGRDRDRLSVLVDDELIDLRELPLVEAERANHVLRALKNDEAPVVDVIGVVSDRRHGGAVDGVGTDLPAVLVTVRPKRALTYEMVLDADGSDRHDEVVDAAIGLLVLLHLVGFVWRDASLSRMRFRHDAGRLSAFLVEVGAGEQHEELSAADRHRDLEAAAVAMAEELVAARSATGDPVGDPHVIRHDIRRRYRRLWNDLTREEHVDVGDQEHGEAQLRRVNDLGFDVGEIQVTGEDGSQVRIGPAVLEAGHHRRRLWRLAHLAVQENQARRLLAEIDHFRSVEPVDEVGRGTETEAASAMRWLHEVFHPTVAAVPVDVRRPDQDDAEIFHEILEHRYYLSERAGHDVGTQAAVDAYVVDVLTPRPEPRRAAG